MNVRGSVPGQLGALKVVEIAAAFLKLMYADLFHLDAFKLILTNSVSS